MKKRIFSLALTFSVFSCTQIMQNTSTIETTCFSAKSVHDNWIKKDQQVFLEKMQNKKEERNDVNFNINHDLLSNAEKTNSFTTKSDDNSSVVFKKAGDFSKHKTNASHIKSGDKNIFDINNPTTFPFDPYKGDVLSYQNTYLGSFSINNSEIIPFESEIIILNFKTSSDLEYFKTKYNAKVLQEEHGFYRMKIDISKSPLNNTKELLDKLNAGIPENIKDLEFSSMVSLKTFLIGVDFLVNDYKRINSIEFSVQGRNDQFLTSSVEWDGGMNGVLAPYHINSKGEHVPDPCSTNSNSTVNVKNYSPDPYFTPTISPIVSSGWSLASANISYVHNSMTLKGKGVKAAIIDGGVLFPNHPEFSNSSKSSRVIYSDDSSPNDCISFNCGTKENDSDRGFYYHGNACAMVGFGNRNVSDLKDFAINKNYKIGTSGIAPEADLLFYHHSFPFMWGMSIYDAIKKDAKVISLSMNIPNVAFLKYFKPINPTDIISNSTYSVVSSFLRPNSLYNAIYTASLNNSPVVISAANYKNPRILNVPADSDDAIVVGAVSPVKFEEDHLLTYSSKKNQDKNRKRTLFDSPDTYSNFLSVDACGVYPAQEFLSNTSYLSIPLYYTNNFDVSTNPIDRDRLGFSVADFSSYGSDIFWAPGKYMFVPNPKQTGSLAYKEIDIYDRFGGSSAATPFVAGTIALIKGFVPSITTEKIKNVLRYASIYQLRSSEEMRRNGFAEYDPNIKMISVEEALNVALKLEKILISPSASTIAGLDINGIIANDKNTLDQAVKMLQAKSGDKVFVPLIGDLSNPRVIIDGVTLPLAGTSGNAVLFEVTSQISQGVKDVTIKTDNGQITLNGVLDIQSQSQTNKFPNSITLNGITTTLDYGFNFDFSEASGNTVFDKSGNNNNATLGGFNGTFPERFFLADGSTGLRFTNEAYLRVPDNNSYEMPNSFTFLSKIKINEINKYQTLLIKGSGVSGLLDSYTWSIDEQNRITLSMLKAGNTNPCTLFTQSVPLYLVTNPLNIQPNETIGLAVSFDQKNKVLKFYKNQTELSYTVAYPIPNSICGNVYDYNRLPDSPLDLFIGSYVYDNGTLHYPDSNLQELYLIANVKNRALNGSEVGKIFYDMGLRD